MINNIVKMGGAPEGYDAALIAKEFEVSKSCVIHIARDDKRMAAVKDALAFFAPDLRVEIFPSWDCLPYDRISPNSEISSYRHAKSSSEIDSFICDVSSSGWATY